ncbi:unnamed protein product, partial [Rangifer tarandus platyrhynchus]
NATATTVLQRRAHVCSSRCYLQQVLVSRATNGMPRLLRIVLYEASTAAARAAGGGNDYPHGTSAEIQSLLPLRLRLIFLAPLFSYYRCARDFYFLCFDLYKQACITLARGAAAFLHEKLCIPTYLCWYIVSPVQQNGSRKNTEGKGAADPSSRDIGRGHGSVDVSYVAKTFLDGVNAAASRAVHIRSTDNITEPPTDGTLTRSVHFVDHRPVIDPHKIECGRSISSGFRTILLQLVSLASVANVNE